MTSLMQHLEKARNSRHWRNSRACKSCQSCDTSMHSVAPHMCWITLYKVGKEHPNEGIAQGSGCTLARHQAMRGQWHSCSTHAQATFHHSSMSSLMIFLRRCKKSPLILTLVNWNGNTSAASQSGRDWPNLAPKERWTTSLPHGEDRLQQQ